MGLTRRHTHLHTYGDYLDWPDDVRYELIDGEAFLMSPAPALVHQEVAGEIYFQLRQALADHPCRVFIAPVDVRLPKAEEADRDIDTVVQPDILVVCDPTKLDRAGVRGAPDLVVEVVSASTAAHDHQIKRQVYERAGVREYWLVHPVDRTLTVYRLHEGQYPKPEVQGLAGKTSVGCLPGIAVDWDGLVERLGPAES
jgi:Uma2 family endonuclease